MHMDIIGKILSDGRIAQAFRDGVAIATGRKPIATEYPKLPGCGDGCGYEKGRRSGYCWDCPNR